LLCPGIPASGKTVLASAVVDHLLHMQSSRTDRTIGVAYTYCRIAGSSTEAALGHMAWFLRQLAPDEPSSVTERISEYLSQRESPTLSNVNKLINMAGALYQRVYLVVDGLDELLWKSRTDRELILNLQSFQDTFGANILLTLRNIPDILDEFPRSDRLEIRATDEDVAILVGTKLENLPRFQREPWSALKDKFKEAISSNPNRT
jgi:hypothetical protein